jgi:hypothetical protein
MHMGLLIRQLKFCLRGSQEPDDLADGSLLALAGST